MEFMASLTHYQDGLKTARRLLLRLREIPNAAQQHNAQISNNRAGRQRTSREEGSKNFAGLPPLPFDGNGSIPTSQDTESELQNIQGAPEASINTRTSAFLDLPGEIRNLIYEYTFVPPLDLDKLPSTHRLPHGLSLLQTCRQIYSEANQWFFAGALVYALHTPRTKFYQDVPAERLRLMKAIYLPASNIEKIFLKYPVWKTRTYDCVIRDLCEAGFHPTTLVFSTDCRIGGFEQRATDSRSARYATALLDLRFALSILKTVERVYVVDIGAPYVLATRDYFADLFERCFPFDLERVRGLDHTLRADYWSPTYYSYPGLATYHGIPGSEWKWEIQRPKSECSTIEDFEFLLATTDNDGVPRPPLQVYTFSNWIDFCKAYRGPSCAPERTREIGSDGPSNVQQ
jgi:hypothetical protein